MAEREGTAKWKFAVDGWDYAKRETRGGYWEEGTNGQQRGIDMTRLPLEVRGQLEDKGSERESARKRGRLGGGAVASISSGWELKGEDVSRTGRGGFGDGDGQGGETEANASGSSAGELLRVMWRFRDVARGGVGSGQSRVGTLQGGVCRLLAVLDSATQGWGRGG